MRRWVTGILCIIMVCMLAACGNKTSDQKAQKEQSAAKTEKSDHKVKNNTANKKTDTNSVVVYFSATGTTKKAAQELAKVLNTDAFEMEPKQPYSSDDLDYNSDDCRANKEMKDDSVRPEIANDLSNVKKYENVYIGYPIWWGTTPRIIQTFLDTVDLKGKNIYLFCTSGGSGVEQSVSDLKKGYPDLKIVSGRDLTEATEDTIKQWIEK